MFIGIQFVLITRIVLIRGENMDSYMYNILPDLYQLDKNNVAIFFNKKNKSCFVCLSYKCIII